jgi:predicted transcriptional regulator
MELKANRIALRISQAKLARLSQVSRFKICMYELGDGTLTAAEMRSIREVLQAEAERLTTISSKIHFGRNLQTVGTGRR